VSKRNPAIGLLTWCVACAAAAEVIHGDALRPPRTPSSVIERGTPRTPEGEIYGWQQSVPVKAPADGRDPRPQLAVERATRALASGQYLEAALQGERALKALESAPGLTRLQLARWLVWLGEVQWRTGALGAAEAHLKRGLAILERALGTGHLEVAAARNKLAVVLQAEGLPGRAEPLHRRALAAQLEVLGPDHLDVATSLNNLAILYKSQGYYEEAEPLYQRALAIRETALGPDHPEVATSLANLGALYEAEGQHERAELLIRPALAIQRQVLGNRHPNVATSLSHLADVYAAQGLYAEAEPLAREAMSIVQAALGSDHTAVAGSLAQLSALSLARGDTAQAAPFAERSLAIREAALGRCHPEVASSLELLAQVRLAQGRFDDALPLLWRSLGLSEARLRREVLDFSERRLGTFLQLLRRDEEHLYALLRVHPNDARLQRLALAVALLRSGRSVEEVSNTSRSVYRSLVLPDRDAFDRLRQLRSQLARLSLDGPRSLDAEAYRRQLHELVEQGDALEAMLARRSARLRAVTTLPSPEEIVDQVADALPQDGALVQFVTYRESMPPWRGARQPGQVRYLALVLAPGGRTGIADLGRARTIDEAVARLRLAIASRDAAYLDAAQAAGALVFEPLRPLLGGARRLFISPDGQLALVPFGALHDGHGFLVDEYELTYVTSGKDLIPRIAEVPRSRSVVVLADPDFDARQGKAGPPAADTRTRAERDYSLAERGATSAYGLARQAVVDSLPGTRMEANALQRLFPRAEVFLGAKATKERLLQVNAPGILHIATHGFFMEDPAVPQGTRGVDAVGPPGGDLPAPPGNPLLRSGLVLAGARSATADGEGRGQGLENSLVTALELAGIDLWGTQLVVLSACDTGRGDIKLGQGVYGLRRALRAAGAETVVMSLWKVDDETTHALMERYYRNLLEGQGRSAALSDAMQALRATQPHPYYWAPFISSGSDAPLVLEDGPLLLSKGGP
jgi:CHAT domain-containing protein/tetratricopeptide (TPR) repeat protein